jgi:hypothetical protein
MRHLWEPDHPYYSGEVNRVNHDTWAEFIENNTDTDWQRNPVVRWDWNRGNDIAIDEGHDSIRITGVATRKGDMWLDVVTVTDQDEPEIRAWLTERWKDLQELWAPIGDPT